ncbi:MAG TPA: autotransporter-associated beta strand repeat-containing protein [Scandinavium sp.]|jgi:fibronectin-binding autotransporter adhesin|uniref:autotransporter-associated beta strand repeat-containing protein n=1 Tax=Scandinavium sp. TaxID=2830653 RepID=UPI002E2EF681|nr:autotransporter-associated beta strand repeat-containing protein [Scandinavium sp.]HEX4500135.1 autotransporter-associated beta strand repeat-containing protein [Scandinavium sp.]
MNTVYRLVWSHTANGFVAVAETARAGKKKKTRGRSMLLATALVAGALPGSALADEVDWADEYPSYLFVDDGSVDYDKVINTGTAFKIDGGSGSDGTSQHFASGTTLDITGAMPVVNSGNGPTSRGVTAASALGDSFGADKGRLISAFAKDANGNQTAITLENIDQFTYSPSPANPQQNQEMNLEVPGLEGSYQVISVYDSSTFTSAEDQAVGNMQMPVYNPDTVHIYNEFGIASVSSDGGTVNVDIGAKTTDATPIHSPENDLELMAKNSILIKTDGTGSAQSDANWKSDNYIHFIPAPVISNDIQSISAQSTKFDFTVKIPQYMQLGTGNIIGLAPKEFHITSSEDIADVNDFLLGQGDYAGQPQMQFWLTKGVEVRGEVIDSAKEVQAIYNLIISEMMAQKETTTIDFSWHVWEDMGAHTNNATLGTGDLNVIYATGAKATGTVTSEGSLAVDGASAVMRGDRGALLTNDGAINAWRSSGGSPTPVGMRVTDSTAINNGTLNAGLFIEKDGTNQNVNNAGSIAIKGDGNSTITNNGHINVAITDGSTHNASGIVASDTTNVVNESGATIALTGNTHNTDGRAGGYAVELSDAATFTNKGDIYIGTTPVTDSSTASATNLVGSGDLTAGIYTSGTGDITNTGTISLLENTRNAAGILIDGGTGTVTNDGTINVLGKLTAGAAAGNYGLYVKDSADHVTNNGDINVDGDNNIAINVQAYSTDASMTSNDTSNITVGTTGDQGGSDNNPYTYRNYAVYAEGLKNNYANVDLDSTVRLLSAGAIGVHARGNATINIGDDASLSFENSQQIGYYAWGENARINVSNADITDSAQTDSILFVVDHGAEFNGDNGSGTAYNLTVDGAGSIGVMANGINDQNDGNAANDKKSSMTTGNAKITVSGDGAMGVKVTGGAAGTINDGAIVLAGDNTTAVSVDGRTFVIDGSNDGTPVATHVDSSAKIGSAAGQTGITGYDVGYSGDIALNGNADIDLQGDESTGIRLHDNGSANVQSGVTLAGSHNIGVDIQNGGTLDITGNITNNGGTNNTGININNGGTVNTSGAMVVNGDTGNVGINIKNGGTVTNSGNILVSGNTNNTGINIDTGGTVTNSGDITVDADADSIGVDIHDGGTFSNTKSITINGADDSGNIGLRIQGAGATVTQLGSVTANGGLAAVQLTGNSATLAIQGSDNHITAGGSADGVLIDSIGASSFSASNTVIDVEGSGAGINNNADSSNVNLNNVTINAADGPAIRTAKTFNAEGNGNVLNVDGSGIGFAFMDANGGMTGGNLTIGRGYTINGTGAGSIGIMAKTAGAVNSGTNITMSEGARAAIDAAMAGSVSNSGNISYGSDVGSTIIASAATSFSNSGNITSGNNFDSTILANSALTFTNTGSVISDSTSNTSALIALNNNVGNRSINNTGTLSTASQSAILLDATGTTNNTLTNSGNLNAASADAIAIAMGSGNDSVTHNGGQIIGQINLADGNNTLNLKGGTQAGLMTMGDGNDAVSITGANSTGDVQMGNGADSFTYTGGSYNGNVDFTGGDGNDSATFGAVKLDNLGHVLTENGSNSALTFNNTTAKIGDFSADDLAKGTNVGSGWSSLTLDGANTDITVVDDLLLSGTPEINVNNGATLRSGNSVKVGDEATIHNYDIATTGNSLISFDGSNSQTYAGVISGSGGMERIGGGTTYLVKDNTYTGDTNIGNGSTLSLGDGGMTGSLSDVTNITDDGVLAVDRAAGSDDVALNGVISGSGAFVQNGEGTTRLGGNNTYAGTTTVNGGTLLINGDQVGHGTTTVNNGGLGGYGTIGGDVWFKDNASTVLTPGDNGAGTLTINGDLHLSEGTDSQWQLGQHYTPGGSFNDLVIVKGDLTLDGEVNVKLSEDGSFLPGVYRLISYDGKLTDNTMDIGVLPPHDPESAYRIQTDVDGQVNLVLNFVNPAQELQWWDGDNAGAQDNGKIDGGDGVWRSTELTPTNNWTKYVNGGNAPWAPTAFAIFAGTAGEVNIDGSSGRVIESGMQFAVDGYKFTTDSDSSLYFMGTVTQEYPAPVPTPENNWTAEGETAADTYHVIRVGLGNYIPGEEITASIDVNLRQDELESRTVRLLKTDDGRLILNGDNHITGGIEVWSGALQVSKDSSLGDAGTSLTLANGAAFQAGADMTFDRKMFLDGERQGTAVPDGPDAKYGGTLDVFGHTLTMGNPLTRANDSIIGGNGPLTITDTSEGTGLDGDTSDGNGVLDINTRNTYQGDTGIFGKDGNGTLTVNANVTGALGNAGSNIYITDDATLSFNNSASTEQHRFLADDATVKFQDSARAESSVIELTNGSLAEFSGNSQGGNSYILTDSNSELALRENADAGKAGVDNSGLVTFADDAQARSAIINNKADALVDLSASNGYTAIGSLSGAGNVELGAATLEEGALGNIDTITGLISGDGGNLVKTGTGSLILSGDNSWTGTTSVKQGSLFINGNQQAATGNTTVDANATLGGMGVIGGDVLVANNGHITAGDSMTGVGELTINGDLTLNDNSQIDFQLGQAYHPGGLMNDVISVKGDLNLDGKLNITETDGGNFDVGIYRIFNYDGELTNGLMDIGVAPEAADDLYVQTSIDNQVNLINRTGYTLRFWDGAGGDKGELKNNSQMDGGDGIWQNSHGNDNWTTDQTDPDGKINAPYSDGSYAIFGGEAGNVTVDNSLGEVFMGGAQFLVDGYVINDGVLTIHNADTQLRVGDGSSDGIDYTTTINSVIAGEGGLRKTDAGTLVLNGDNTYAGGTAVSGGVLQVSSDNNLGAADSAITLRGGVLRYAEAFNTSREVKLANGGGAIDTYGHDISLLNKVTGEGDLHKFGDGTLTLTQDSTFAGTTWIEQGTLELGNGGTGGSVTGDIVDDSMLALNRSDSFTLNGDISGEGQVWQKGTGTTSLNGENSWSGITLVENGTLKAASENSFSAASDHVVSMNGTLATSGYNQEVANLSNQGTVNLRGDQIGNALTVHGDYTGLDGTIALSAQRQSVGVSDRLVIDGGDVAGVTWLDIDASHLGEPTVGDGIKVVQAENGATTTAQTSKDAFTLGADAVMAGAWEYQLFAGDAQGQGEDWYLRAGYRPDVPGFDSIATTIRQADLAVLGTLHLRVGDELDAGKTKPVNDEERFWARYIVKSVDQKLDDATGTTTSANYNGMQMGFDLWHNEKWRAGFYTTFMDTDAQMNGFTGMRGGAGYNSTFSTYLGGYATWTDTNGLYVDNVLQYGYHSADLRNYADNETTQLDGSSFAGSVEVGKPWYLGDSKWMLEPQAQLIYQYSDFGAVTLSDSAKSRVKIDSDVALIGRVGGRLAVDVKTDNGNIRPYARVNYWQGLTGGQDTVTWSNSANGSSKTEMKTSQDYSAVEAGLGATWEFTPDVSAYTEVTKTWSTGGSIEIDADMSASLGMKIRF